MNIYFAGAIRGGRDDQEFYQAIIGQLRRYGRVLTEHVGSERLTGQGELDSNQAIYERDLNWLRAAGCLVAEVTTPSLGVGYEIGKATEWGKRVLCLFRPEAGRVLSAMIAGNSQVVVAEYATPADVAHILEDFFGQPPAQP